MKLFKKTQRAQHAGPKPTWRERRAAERTARAEATLLETEQRIHQIADQARSEIRDAR